MAVETVRRARNIPFALPALMAGLLLVTPVAHADRDGAVVCCGRLVLPATYMADAVPPARIEAFLDTVMADLTA